jgi:hypothetical protein
VVRRQGAAELVTEGAGVPVGVLLGVVDVLGLVVLGAGDAALVGLGVAVRAVDGDDDGAGFRRGW